MAIAGYTNAGKSSLLNRLTGAGVLVENALFATLDPTVRRAETPDGRDYTLADTVGFVRHLPHQLVEAFRSTLEEVAEADLILHVVDGSDADPEAPARRGARGARRRRRARTCPSWSSSTRPTWPTRWSSTGCGAASGTAWSCRPAPGEGIDELRQLIARELPRPSVAGRRAAALRPGRPGLPGARRRRAARAGPPRRGHLGACPGDRRRWRPSWRRTPSARHRLAEAQPTVTRSTGLRSSYQRSGLLADGPLPNA